MNFSEMSVEKIKKYIDEKELKDLLELIPVFNKDSRKSVNELGNKILKKFEQKNKEILRVMGMYNFDSSFANNSNVIIAGVDEVGRGPLAGPIVAAAVSLPLKCVNNENLILNINDSKKLTAKKRRELSAIIKEKAISYSIVEIDNISIDNNGIAWCNNEVLKRSALSLNVKPQLVISDGYAVKGLPINNKFVIKGDSKSASIACASIIAKVYRDELMVKYHEMYSQYGFNKNAGYGTEEHIAAIKKYGPTPIHRRSFLRNIL